MYAPPALTFDSFTSRAANAPALDAARRVAAGGADAPALLVLHGPSGAGKTHLLSAVGAARRARAAAGGPVVEYVSVAELVTRLRVTATWGEGDAQGRRYAQADLLLVDDAQRAAADPDALRVLADLLAAGKPGRHVVLALDCPPAVLAAADARLAGLLDAATVCHVAPLLSARRASASPSGVAEERPVAQLANQGAAPRPPVAEPLAAFADADETIGGPPHPAPGSRSERAPEPRNDYASFLSDVVAAVTQHVEPWKQRLAEESNRWGALGYGVAVLERALARATAPDVDGLLATYAAAVEHLRRLEAQATAIDPDLAGSPAFRDPARVADAEAAIAQLLPPGPDAFLTQATFIASGSNAAAARAAAAVVAEPGAAHNPLYLHGPSGSGRTHLLAAATNALRGWGAGRVAYVVAPQLAEELAAAMRANTVERWRARYASVDVLAVDDVHELAGNARAEQELALLCATLRDRGRQLLLAGAADPSPEGKMGEGLRLQIARGLAAPLDAPDRDLRARLVTAYFAAARRDVDAEVVSYLAERVEPSAHSIAPTAERLLAAADRAGVPLTLSVARAELGRTPARTPLWAVSAGGGRGDPFFLDAEKVVWDWPDVAARAIEELR